MSLKNLSSTEKERINTYSLWGMEQEVIAKSLGIPQPIVNRQIGRFSKERRDRRKENKRKDEETTMREEGGKKS